MNTNRRPDWLVELRNSSNRDCDTKDDVLVNDDEDDVDGFSAVLFDLSWVTASKVAQSTISSNVNGDKNVYYGDAQDRAREAPAYPQSLYP